MTASDPRIAHLRIGMDVAYASKPHELIGRIREFEHLKYQPPNGNLIDIIDVHVLAPGYRHSASLISPGELVEFSPSTEGREQ